VKGLVVIQPSNLVPDPIPWDYSLLQFLVNTKTETVTETEFVSITAYNRYGAQLGKTGI
jgi:hypothetical protein